MNLAAIKQILGSGGFIDDPSDMAPYLTEWRDRWSGATPLVARPRTVDEVAAVVQCCAESGIPVVPQGGHTGLCGGAMPNPDGSEIILSLERLNKILDVDRSSYALTAQAGCTLAVVQQAAADAGLLFPLSLASEGTAQIGGILSTNAGGNAVLRYGSARQLALGLQVVLPSGDVWNGLTSLGKDNTGYDLKQLFIGAEGTLGIITAAVLKLFPQPRQTVTAFAALDSVEDAIALLELMRDQTGDQHSAFELVPRRGLEFVVKHMDRCRDPLADPSPWYLLIEATSPQSGNYLAISFETALAAATDQSLITNAVIAQSKSHRDDLWRLRDNLSEAQKFEGGSIKHDISVSIRS
ncbi:MAG: FAD-binding oxidoreductase, partial [Proteobacteria bacterium]|nr:FAD-binding oxidoreductase [Pseudomonadota bacterium]